MHGPTIAGEALPYYTRALLEEQFAYRGELFGRPIPAGPEPSMANPQLDLHRAGK
jgi:hypothetical protein